MPDLIPTTGATTATVSFSQLLSALSHALDLTEGQPIGHTVRSCVIGMRLGAELGLDPERLSALYYALLLKDAGCSSNAARMSALFGSDDAVVKARMKLADWHKPIELALTTAQLVARRGTIRDRVRHFLGIAREKNVTRDLMAVRCDRGASIALQLGFPDETALAIRSLDEHWCGKGYPEGRVGDEIPLLARICNLAQVLEVFLREGGVRAAIDVARRRRGRWFDPRLVDVVCGWSRDAEWWGRLRRSDLAESDAVVVALEPRGVERAVDQDGLDAVSAAFAEIIDAKTPYTYRHSSNVSAYAVAIARAAGADADEQRRLRRAGLLHDIGKLGVSNRILDKNGPLTAEEREAVEAHPRYSWEILSRVSAFGEFAWMASVHHEKLDGSGYPWKLTAERLDRPSRVLAVADIFEALTADRPYRAGMTPDAALALIARSRGTALCADAIDALESCVASGTVPATA